MSGDHETLRGLFSTKNGRVTGMEIATRAFMTAGDDTPDRFYVLSSVHHPSTLKPKRC
jgi:hypothetical protein